MPSQKSLDSLTQKDVKDENLGQIPSRIEFTLKTRCPYCGKVYWAHDPLEKPLWLCLKCGRIFPNESQAKECRCLIT